MAISAGKMFYLGAVALLFLNLLVGKETTFYNNFEVQDAYFSRCVFFKMPIFLKKHNFPTSFLPFLIAIAIIVFLIFKQHFIFCRQARNFNNRLRISRILSEENAGECVYNYPGPPKACSQKRISGITSELPEYKEPNICIVDVKHKNARKEKITAKIKVLDGCEIPRLKYINTVYR